MFEHNSRSKGGVELLIIARCRPLVTMGGGGALIIVGQRWDFHPVWEEQGRTASRMASIEIVCVEWTWGRGLEAQAFMWSPLTPQLGPHCCLAPGSLPSLLPHPQWGGSSRPDVGGSQAPHSALAGMGGDGPWFSCGIWLA